MRQRLLLLLVMALAASACGTAGRRSASSPPSSTAGTAVSLAVAASRSTPTATAGLEDVGLFIVSTTGPVVVSNRATAAIVHVAPSDVIRFPGGMQWDSGPNYVPNPEYFLAASTTVAGRKLYLSVNGTEVHFERVDERTFRPRAVGDLLIAARDEDDFYTPGGRVVDHGVAVDAQGHLWLDPARVPASAVINFNTGEQLDVSGAEQVGSLPIPAQGFVLTTCENGTCFLSYRGAETLTPVAGALECGATVDVAAATYRLQYQWIDTGWLPPSQGTPTPPNCTPKAHIAAGEPVGTKFAHWIVRAVSLSGEPLSVVAAGDGTIYVGRVTPQFTCPPCSGT